MRLIVTAPLCSFYLYAGPGFLTSGRIHPIKSVYNPSLQQRKRCGMFQADMECHLWDLVDEGIEEVLDRLKGEAGVTGVCVPAVVAPVHRLRPHDVSPRTFITAGGIQFQPQSELYAATRVRPVVAAWLRKSNPLAAVAEACRKRGLGLRASVTCARSPATVERHAFAGVKDAFGDLRQDWLCPVNPDVREYLRTLLEDLSRNYPLEAVELLGLGFPPARIGPDGPAVGCDVGALGDWLLNLCFCESCRQTATRDGLDAQACIRSARAALERILTRDEPPSRSPQEFLGEEPLLSVWQDWRLRQVTELLGSLSDVCRTPMVVRLNPPTQYTGLEVAAKAAVGLQVAMSSLGDDAVDAGFRDLPPSVEVSLSARHPECRDAASLVRAVSRLARAGFRRVRIEDYGSIPVSRLDWVKQAVRYARRESADAGGG